MTITSFTNESVKYETTEHSCSCPDFQYRGSKTGKQCKHQVWLAKRTASANAISQAIADERARVEREETAASYYRMSLAS